MKKTKDYKFLFFLTFIVLVFFVILLIISFNTFNNSFFFNKLTEGLKIIINYCNKYLGIITLILTIFTVIYLGVSSRHTRDSLNLSNKKFKLDYYPNLEYKEKEITLPLPESVLQIMELPKNEDMFDLYNNGGPANELSILVISQYLKVDNKKKVTNSLKSGWDYFYPNTPNVLRNNNKYSFSYPLIDYYNPYLVKEIKNKRVENEQKDKELKKKYSETSTFELRQEIVSEGMSNAIEALYLNSIKLSTTYIITSYTTVSDEKISLYHEAIIKYNDKSNTLTISYNKFPKKEFKREIKRNPNFKKYLRSENITF